MAVALRSELGKKLELAKEKKFLLKLPILKIPDVRHKHMNLVQKFNAGLDAEAVGKRPEVMNQ